MFCRFSIAGFWEEEKEKRSKILPLTLFSLSLFAINSLIFLWFYQQLIFYVTSVCVHLCLVSSS